MDTVKRTSTRKNDAPVNFKKLQLLQEIKELYEQQDHMLSADRDIFTMPLRQGENHTIMQLQEYTKFATHIKKRSKADAVDYGGKFRKMTEYVPIIKHKKMPHKKILQT